MPAYKELKIIGHIFHNYEKGKNRSLFFKRTMQFQPIRGYKIGYILINSLCSPLVIFRYYLYVTKLMYSMQQKYIKYRISKFILTIMSYINYILN